MKKNDWGSLLFGILTMVFFLLLCCEVICAAQNRCEGCSKTGDGSRPCSSSRWTLPPGETGDDKWDCHYTGKLTGQCKTTSGCNGCSCAPLNEIPTEDTQCDCQP